VAANDGIMPKTVEAISHARAANVPIVVAVNKCDLADADPTRVKRQLLEHSLVPEDLGGDIVCVECSAKTGDGLPDLLEALVLVAEMEELSGNTRFVPEGIVIEAQIDKGRGPVATVLVRDGTLKQGDCLVIGTCYGRVRRIMDHEGNEVRSAGPSTPVAVLGLNDVPAAGQRIEVVKNERRARQIAEENAQEKRDESRPEEAAAITLEGLFAQVRAGQQAKLNVVLKADVQGSVEAIVGKLQQLHNDDVSVEVKHAAVGPIGKTDVDLAKTTSSIVIGFNTHVDPQVRALADDEGVEIRMYAVIYHLLDDVRQALEGLLEPEYVQETLGHAEVLQVFEISRTGSVAGCRVVSGSLRRGQNLRVIRERQVIFDGRLDSLRRVKDNVEEVHQGFECGVYLRGFAGFQAGDMLECYAIVAVARQLQL
ncbi:MAG: translation initiation factor IF-2, partial [Armatimonadetes bacterium]|nr:translation initiation factor IF-2 [Armatimonadota bacterium]